MGLQESAGARQWAWTLAARPRRDLGLWHSSYVQTYLERDVRSLRQVGDLTQFQGFLRALAARSAQLLSLSDRARDPCRLCRAESPKRRT